MSTILTEPVPGQPAPQHHPGAYLVGTGRMDRGAEYGAPAVMAGVVAFTPQHMPGRSGQTGHDDPAPSLGDIIGPRAAIGSRTRP